MIKYKINPGYEPGDWSKEPKNEMPSMTIPDQSYTIKQLLEFHSKGISPPIQHKEIYEDEFGEDGNPLRKQNLDITDIDQIKENIDKSMEAIDSVNKMRFKRKKEAEKKAIIDEHEKSKTVNDSLTPLPK